VTERIGDDMSNQQFFGVKAERNAVVRERVPVGQLGDGTPITLPVIVIGGAQDGPTIYLQAGVHGDEVTGIEVLRGILAQVTPSDLRGTIVAVPTANPPAFISKTRGFLLEERGPFDMNRIFPGAEHGVLSERIAHVLFHEFVLKADFTVDFHSALAGCNIHPFVYVDPADDDTGTLEIRERMARAIGTDLLYYKKRGAKLGTSAMGGSLSSQADQHRKPAIMLEMGESQRISWDVMDRCVTGGVNMLRALGMLPGAPAPAREQRRFSTIGLVHGDRAGLFHPKVVLGQEVRKGQVLGEVVDVLGDRTEAVVAPNDGVVLRVMLNSPVMSGAELFWVVW
jgi:predicted deacylase